MAAPYKTLLYLRVSYVTIFLQQYKEPFTNTNILIPRSDCFYYIILRHAVYSAWRAENINNSSTPNILWEIVEINTTYLDYVAAALKCQTKTSFTSSISVPLNKLCTMKLLLIFHCNTFLSNTMMGWLFRVPIIKNKKCSFHTHISEIKLHKIHILKGLVCTTR